jgi:putative ABC transport system ATP-binding protein
LTPPPAQALGVLPGFTRLTSHNPRPKQVEMSTATALAPTLATTLAIDGRSISKQFGQVHVLNGIDMTAQPGEWVALMGPSGCGKSTLLNLIGGLDDVSSGEVMVAGTDITSMTPSQRAVFRRRNIGFVFQAFNLIPYLDVGSNIELALRLNSESRRAARERSLELVERLGLMTHLNAAPSTLSGGQQQRIAIARAIANRPTVLLADEPTGSLDSESSASVMALLRAEHDAGQTIVMVTHDQDVANHADRMMVMRDGRWA